MFVMQPWCVQRRDNAAKVDVPVRFTANDRSGMATSTPRLARSGNVPTVIVVGSNSPGNDCGANALSCPSPQLVRTVRLATLAAAEMNSRRLMQFSHDMVISLRPKRTRWSTALRAHPDGTGHRGSP